MPLSQGSLPSNSQDSNSHTSGEKSPGSEFETLLASLEESLKVLRGRYEQIQQDQQRRVLLQQELDQSQWAYHQEQEPELRIQLHQIQRELEVVEVALESRLISWEPFWQVVRFGGLGIVVGWVLKSCVG